ncbi:DUF11 domain-containing protein [Sphingomonas albertensis]|uniref:DUF11 domain-containing protein n=1 Tax=Sphingomonas albertensis TaxID=2762591 RepID=A0ABR7AJU4_9SPHN|nr:DUF11 domain-containing protein [Sphingomonas albertensis]MBC3940671.1 DUF11 domain-containing protein [Sphingomonas albertensis]
MITRPMIAAVLAATAAVASAAAGPLQVTSSILVESRTAAADGTTRIALVKPSKVTPGDKVIFVLRYRNTGAQPLANVVLDNPLPRQIAYRSANPGSPAPDVSVDGKTFGSLATLRVRSLDGSTRAAGPNDVTSVRWRLASPLAAGSQGQFAFQAVLK